MTPSPFRTTFFERRNDRGSSAVESSPPPSPPLSLKFAWKTPVLVDRPSKVTAPIENDENEEEAESSHLPPLRWKAPIIIRPPSEVNTEENEPEMVESRSPIPPPSSSSFVPEDDQGDFELESVLLEEEEYSVAEYCRHRKETGLAYLDDLFASETHAFPQEGEKQRGGLACGSALEIAGTPGSGKTSILIQMAIRERINGLLRARQNSNDKGKDKEVDWIGLGDDVASQVLLIDTEGGIGMDRIIKITQGQIVQLDSTQQTSSPGFLRLVLAGIHYCRCTSDTELLALFQTLLPNSKRHFTSVKHDNKESKAAFTSRLPLRSSMILIDTISYPLRASLADEARQLRNQKTRLINELKHFAERCTRRGINLILANQMSFTMVGKEGNTTSLSDKEGEGRLVPLLRNQGDSILGPSIWRLVLFRAGNHDLKACSRFAHLMGHPSTVSQVVDNIAPDWLPLQIDQNGVSALPFFTR